ncbi:polysaccharide biosynthesis/export family protein [Marivita sp. S0852]|uniref:polysaccharide biosynthesis/export family protein n=1 Tax=Marivita sp. S0852 TaxID=3373893 RepID=UPI003981F674
MLSTMLSKAGIGLAALMVFGGIETLPSLVGDNRDTSLATAMTVATDSMVHRARHETDMPDSMVSYVMLKETEPQSRGLLDRILSGNSCDSGSDVADRAVVGDHLTLRVFEHSESNFGRFERRDLSGTFAVGSTGEVAIPGIGRVPAQGKPLTCLETAVRDALSSQMKLSTTVTASFAKRPPVLVKGEVISPGSYEYDPGLTVDRLLAKSGDGSSSSHAALRRSLEARREELRTLRSGLLLRQKRLSAQRAPEETFPLFDGTVDVAIRQIEDDRIRSEVAVLEAAASEREIREARDSARRAELEATLELANSRRSMVAARYEDLKLKRDALEREVSSECRGRCNSNRHFAELRLESMNDQVADFALVLQDAETRVIEARHAVNRHDRTIQLERAESSKALALDIVETHVRQSAIDAELASVEQQLRALGALANRVVTVNRQNGDDIRLVEPNETTRLLPGDIVTVGTAGDTPLVSAERVLR